MGGRTRREVGYNVDYGRRAFAARGGIGGWARAEAWRRCSRETEREATLPEVLEVLGTAPGVSFFGEAADFPTPVEAVGNPGVFVRRVRVEGNVIEYWCVSDNLLKGAATNAVQITISGASYLALT
jgi:hypothetical protein